MNSSRLPSTVLSSLLVLVAAAPLAIATQGCAAPADESQPGVDAEQNVAETQDELTSAASQLVGSYWTHAATFGGFGRLNLKSNGKYTASVDPAGTALCVTFPCLLPEDGTWNATKISGGYRLRIRAAGQTSRWYTAVKSGATLKLTGNGDPQTLNKLGANECLDNADCSASEECGPKVCLMWCAAGDPTCCGTSSCQPKTPTPPPSCGGAWLDQFGGCRTPADGVYPDSCCADLPRGPVCGPHLCGAGQVCCNPLSGICTNPGDVCAM